MQVESGDKVRGRTKGGLQKPLGKGSHLIILHAGSENSWVNGTGLVFQRKKAIGNYHDKMNATTFEEWFHDKLLPKTPSKSLIVMDNAPYLSQNL